MADDPIKRLEEYGRRATPPIDDGFADRLESHLRAEHAAVAPRRRPRLPVLLPRLAMTAVIVIAAVLGAVALRGDDPGVPIAVVEGQTPVADAPVPATGADDGDDRTAAEPTPTPTADRQTDELAPTAEPTATPAPPRATATRTPGEPPGNGNTATPTPGAAAPPDPTVAVPVVAPTAVPPVTAEPTPTVPVRPTVTPAPDPLPTSTAVVVPTPTTRPTPTVPPEPADVALVCRRRVAGDAVGVICEWREPATDRTIVEYEVVRSSNGGEAVVVSRQRSNAPLQFVDRDVAPGDALTYLVRARDADGRIVAASVREVVEATR